VCAKLGVFDNQTERVQIKFCNPLYGCNFAKCPHRDEDDQQPLFRLPTEEMNAGLEFEKVCFRGDDVCEITSIDSTLCVLFILAFSFSISIFINRDWILKRLKDFSLPDSSNYDISLQILKNWVD
jgi:hypothetical protein